MKPSGFRILLLAGLACAGPTLSAAREPLPLAAVGQPGRRALEAGLIGRPDLRPAQTFDGAIEPAPHSGRPGLLTTAPWLEQRRLDAPARPETVLERGPTARWQELAEPDEAGIEDRTAMNGTGAAADPRAKLRSEGDETLDRVHTFQWSAAPHAEAYHLSIGSCPNCGDILDQNVGLKLSQTADVPADGRAVYVTLFTRTGGLWYWMAQPYAGPSVNEYQPARIYAPTYGATLSTTQTFRWDGGYGVREYYLRIGSCWDCGDILEQSQGGNLSRTVNLPSDGRTIFVKLFSLIGDDWYSWHEYRAALRRTGCSSTLLFTNHLIYSMNIYVNGALVGAVPAGETRSTGARECSVAVRYQLVRPRFNGRALGDPVEGRFATIQNPSGTERFTFVAGGTYFAPVVTNSTAVPLLLAVDVGLLSENRCNCVAPAGSRAVAFGYYRLYRNSNVFAFRDGSGYKGSYVYFRDLSGYVARDSGVVELTFTRAPRF